MSEKHFANGLDGVQLYYDIALGIIVTSTILAIFLTYMTIDIGPFKLPGGIFAIALSFSIVGFISEVFTPNYFFRTIGILVLCGFLFTGTLYIFGHLSNEISTADHKSIFEYTNKLYRPAFADLISGIVGYFVNFKILNRWKIKAENHHYYVRNVGSAAVGEAIYNTVWVLMVFTGVYGAYDVAKIIVSMWICKIALTAIYSIPAVICAEYVKTQGTA